MWPGFSKLVYSLQCLVAREDGQDLVEYALLVGLIASGVTASLRPFAQLLLNTLVNINTQFLNTV